MSSSTTGHQAAQEEKEDPNPVASFRYQHVNHPPPSSSSRQYENLISQIATLNNDIQKTTAMCCSLKEENEHYKSKYTKAKTELEKIQERYVKSQETLMAETEAKIESDKRHEALVFKWKRQLEQKQKSFEALRKQYAPPKDLDQLRLKIQEEVEAPHQERVQLLQAEVDKYNEMFYSVRREYEILKTQHEQSSLDHSNEIEAIQAAHGAETAELRRVIRETQNRSEDSNHLEKIRELDLLRSKSEVKNRKLEQEITEIRNERNTVMLQLEERKSKHAMEMSTVQAELVELKVTLSAMERQVKNAKEEHGKMKINYEEAIRQVTIGTDATQRLSQQLQQKELLLVENHSTMNSRLIETRSEYERERATLKEQVAVLTEKTVTLEAAQTSWETHSKKKNKEVSETFQRSTMALETRIHQLEEERDTLEQKAQLLTEQVKQLQDEMMDTKRKTDTDKERLEKQMEQVIKDKEKISTEANQSNDLISKLKVECMTLRSKAKEVESEYKILQSKHRDTLDQEQELQMEREQLALRIQYLQEDMEKGQYIQYGTTVGPSNDTADPSNARVETLTKKCQLYKRKLLELHQVHKKVKAKATAQAQEISRLQKVHAFEMRNMMSKVEVQQHPIASYEAFEQEQTRQLESVSRTLDGYLNT